MSATKVEETEFRLDGLKWLVVAALVLGGAVANSYYASDFVLLYRVLVLLVVGFAAAYVAVNTAKGNAFWDLLKAAQVEVRKVVWPSRQETTQTTLIVSGVVVVAAIILWALDAGLGFLASKIIV
ncbi:preprotein translocase subunit SecE [Teredinibacter purpureus]|uniref:preprotein translocase subunit SecE n=1 Tax=Teredinibacter purpureus TaxID=2731756 RepID=UPI0005F88B33|nr:preprotein translocase subunit SecE [Teredinibacter purpureus]